MILGANEYVEQEGGDTMNKKTEDNKNEIKEFDNEVLKNMKIISINEAKSILEFTLTKPINRLNINESDLLEAQKSTKIVNNLKENLTH